MERMKEGQLGLREEVALLHEELREHMQEFRAEMNSRFDALDRLILRGGVGLFGTMTIGFLSLVLTQH